MYILCVCWFIWVLMDLNLINPLLVNTEYRIGDRYRLFEVQIYRISVELKNPYWYTSTSLLPNFLFIWSLLTAKLLTMFASVWKGYNSVPSQTQILLHSIWSSWWDCTKHPRTTHLHGNEFHSKDWCNWNLLDSYTDDDFEGLWCITNAV